MESVGAGPVSVCCAEFRCGSRVGGSCVLDLFSRKLLASPTAEYPDAELAGDAIKMAAAVCGGGTVIDGVIFHADRGSTHTAKDFTRLCRRLGVLQSMGRVRSFR